MEGQPAPELTLERTDRRPVGARRVLVAVAARPRLWPAALRQARALVPPGWWRRRPFLPVPDRQWLRFRLTTAYGDPGADLDVDDLLTWLAWTETVRTEPVRTGPIRTDAARSAAGSHRP